MLDRLRGEHQRGENSLRPRGARLVRGGDDDVGIPRTEVVPACAVEVMVAVFTGALGAACDHPRTLPTSHLADSPNVPMQPLCRRARGRGRAVRGVQLLEVFRGA